MKYFLLVLALASISLAACYYDNEQDLYINDNSNPIVCDTTGITYSGSILPIISAKCSKCHAAANYSTLGGNIRLDSYSDIQVYSANGRIMGAISHSPGYSAMPQNDPALSSCEIAFFKHWIQIGTPNN